MRPKKAESETFLKKGTGVRASDKVQPVTPPAPHPPKAGAFKCRSNPPNTAFRQHYERGDLPISVDHKAAKNGIKWRVRMKALPLKLEDAWFD